MLKKTQFNDGGDAGGGYTVFKFGLEFKKKHYLKNLGDRKWVVEEVYLVPNESTEERQLCLMQNIREAPKDRT